MKRAHVDERCSLWDLGLERSDIDGHTYVLQGPPERGGSCLVYRVLKQENIAGKVYEHRILLKEFYPVLEDMGETGIRRLRTGELEVPEEISRSASYKESLRRFQEAYGVMLALSGAEAGVEHAVTVLSLYEANGTWYMEEVYDSGESLTRYLAGKKLKVKDFFKIFKKCLTAVESLHELGYYHLDLKPENLSYTKQGIIKLFDTDSFIKKEDLCSCPVLAWTEGYSAPEVQAAALSPEDAPYLIGPWTDIYSMAQILCWFLYGHPLRADRLSEELERLEENVKRIDEVSVCSAKGIYLLRKFIATALNPHRRSRYCYLRAVMRAIENLEGYFIYRHGQILDNFRESRTNVKGFSQEYKALDRILKENQVVCLLSEDEEKRARVGRYYATLRWLEYSHVFEIHRKRFCSLFHEIPQYPETNGKYIKSSDVWRLEKPLFVIFDENDYNDWNAAETSGIKELLEASKDGRILIIARHNRCEKYYNGKVEFKEVDLDHFQPIEEPETEEVEDDWMMEDWEDDLYEEKEYHWRDFVKDAKNGLKTAACGLAKLCARIGSVYGGYQLIRLADQYVDPKSEWDEHLQTWVYCLQTGFQAASLLHILGISLMVAGIVYQLYRFQYRRKGFGSMQSFLKRYRWITISGYLGAMVCTLPGFFGGSVSTYIDAVYGQWDNDFETYCVFVMVYYWIVLIAACVMLLYEILFSQTHHVWGLNLTALLLAMCSLLGVITKTWLNPWEIMLVLVSWVAGAVVIIYLGRGKNGLRRWRDVF